MGTTTATRPAKTATLSEPLFVVGRLLNGRMLEAFAILRTEGCKVTYRETTRTLTQIAYHDFRVTGPADSVDAFIDWLNTMLDRQEERRGRR